MADGAVIGQATVVRGNLRGDGSVEIYGRVEGDVIVSGDVTLGENAVVRGSVSGARVSIGGTVQGDLDGSEAVVLGSSAQVNGDVTAPRIGIEEGAQLNGAVRTGERAQSGARAEQRRVSRPEATRSETAPRRAPAPSPTAVATASAGSAPASAAVKRPPAPVVPAIRRALAKKKVRRP